MASFTFHNELLFIDDLPHATDQEKVDFAIKYFNLNKGRGVKGLYFEKPIILTKPVEIPATFTFKASGKWVNRGKDPNIIIASQRPRLDFFTCLPRKENTGYTLGQSFINLNIKVTEEIPTVINISNGSSQQIENCIIDGNDLASSCIIVGDPQKTPRSVGTLIVRCDIKGARVAGLIYSNCGNNHFILDTHIRHCGAGIFTSTAGMQIMRCSIEKNEGGAIMAQKDSRLEVQHSYFENGSIVLDQCDHLRLISTKLSGGNILSKSTNLIRVEDSRMYGTTIEFEGERPFLVIEGCRFTKEKVLTQTLLNHKRALGRQTFRVAGNFFDH